MLLATRKQSLLDMFNDISFAKVTLRLTTMNIINTADSVRFRISRYSLGTFVLANIGS